MASFTIQLHKLRFFAEHGVYQEEAAVGNEFEVNMTLDIDAPDKTLTRIDDTINYATVYRIVQNIFSVREQLLETIAMKMAEAVKAEFPQLKKIAVQVIKLHLPIVSFTGSVSITFHKEYTD